MKIMSSIDFLSQIALIMFVGLIMGILARKLRVPTMLLLILAGAVLGNLSVDGNPLFQISEDFLLSASIIALVMIVFEGSSNFTLREIDTYSESAVKIAILFLVLNMLFLSIAVFTIFNIQSMFLSLIFAALMSGTDPGSVLSLFQTKSNKITETLKFESVINTPIIVLIPFIILDIVALDAAKLTNFFEYMLPFLQQIITGIGTGVVIGIIVFRFMRRFYSEKLSAFTLITSALLAYVLSEKLGGNGVLGVTVIGVFFGNVTVKKKVELKEFANTLSRILEILVFMLIGFLLPINVDIIFIAKSLFLFLILIIIRFIAIQLVYFQDHMNFKERIFMSLNSSKGIAVAVVAFILINYKLEIPIDKTLNIINEIPLTNLPGTTTIIELTVLFIIYSIILSSIAARFSQKFIRLKVEE